MLICGAFHSLAARMHVLVAYVYFQGREYVLLGVASFENILWGWCRLRVCVCRDDIV